MKPEELRAITNHFLDLRLISLSSWPLADQISPHDGGGPYVVAQAGYDPADGTVRFNEFVLSRSGRWLAVGAYLQLPEALRRVEFVFGTAREVMELLQRLPPKVTVATAADLTADAAEAPVSDDLNAAFEAGRLAGAKPLTEAQP
jgi:hypothetical protein